MRSPRALALCLGAGVGISALAMLSGCHRHDTTMQSTPHYVVGKAWRGSDSWFYPAEHFDLTETGLAVIQAAPQGGVTADGEIWSAQAMTGAHQTLQLPCVVSVRNLVNGRIVRIRLNDRGPARAGRMLAVTPAVAELLGMGPEPVPVEMVVDEAVSRQIAESNPDAPKLEIAAAPREAITAQSLDDGSTRTLGLTSDRDRSQAKALYLPDLPRTIMQGQAETAQYQVVLGSFAGRAAASHVAARCGAMITLQPDGRGILPWMVALGPFTTVAQADRALAQARQCGGTGAHIVAK